MPNEDYRDARESRRREREVHLQRRRQSGQALSGGRSEGKTTLSSDTGLAETETIAVNAVTAVTEVSDPDLIVPGTSLAADDYFLLTSTEVVGAGHLVDIYYTDRMQWSGSVTDYCYILYRLRVIDSDNVTVGELNQYVMECTDGSSAVGNVYSHPSLSVQVELTEGRTYTVQVHTFWHVDAGGDGLGTISTDRLFTITDLKR